MIRYSVSLLYFKVPQNLAELPREAVSSNLSSKALAKKKREVIDKHNVEANAALDHEEVQPLLQHLKDFDGTGPRWTWVGMGWVNGWV